MNHIWFSILSLAIFGAIAYGVEEDGEEEVKRVIPTIPQMFLSSAGPKPTAEEMVRPFSTVTVCSDDYPEGFSFRCQVNTGPDFPVVVFRVGGQVYRKERTAPYYLGGDTPIKVRPFPYADVPNSMKFPDGRIRIACRVRMRKPVWIDLLTKC